MFICQYCSCQRKSKNSLVQHEIRCDLNKNKLESVAKTEKWYDAMHARKGNGTNQYTKAVQNGLPKPSPSDTSRKKWSESTARHNRIRFANDENRLKHSLIMQETVRKYPNSYTKNNVCGRIKTVEYRGAKLKGSWELKTAQWLDYLNEEWIHEVNPQEYIWNNKSHLYFPDFYLPNRNVYIEVKGYKTDRDTAKWTQFKGTLIIIDKTIIHKLNTLTLHDLGL